MAPKLKSEEPRKFKRKSKPKLEEAYLYDMPNLHLNFPPQEQASKHTRVDQSPFLSSTLPQSGESSLDRRVEVLKLQKENLQLELQVLQLRKQISPPIHDDQEATSSVQPTPLMSSKAKRHVDWPSDFIPGMTKPDYDKIDIPGFFAGFLAMIKPYDSTLKPARLLHLELLATKAISYSWNSVRSFSA